MPSIHMALLFMAAGLALNFTPGPDMLYVAARSTSEGRVAGLASAIGIFVGCLFHIAAMAFGLSALLLRVPSAYDTVRFLGAGYLVFLGVRALFWPPNFVSSLHVQAASRMVVFLQGIWTNLLNPKVALFFLAFLPQFLEPGRGPIAVQIVVLGMLFNTTGLIVNGGVALLASRATGWLRQRPETGRWLQRFTGALLVGLGVRMALAGRR
jgi:threonine/homoserine/homoserine lactone efflux protein